MYYNVKLEVDKDRFIQWMGQAVCLWIERSGCSLLDTEQSKHCRKELTHKFSSVVDEAYTLGCCKDEQMIHEEVCNVRCCHLQCGYCSC